MCIEGVKLTCRVALVPRIPDEERQAFREDAGHRRDDDATVLGVDVAVGVDQAGQELQALLDRRGLVLFGDVLGAVDVEIVQAL